MTKRSCGSTFIQQRGGQVKHDMEDGIEKEMALIEMKASKMDEEEDEDEKEDAWRTT
jgi:hypothetical protein